MKVWLVKVGEPLPIDEGQPRLIRMGLLAQALVARGHEVEWWASAFDFRTKTHRARESRVLPCGDGLTIRLVPSPGFRRHRSLERLRDNAMLGRAFRRLIAGAPPPDLIVSAYPTIELSHVAVTVGRSLGIPVVVDVRDLWPEIFLRAVPRGLRTIGRIALTPAYRKAKTTLRGATVVTGIAPEFLEWTTRFSGRRPHPLDHAFAHAYPDPRLSEDARQRGLRFWAERGIAPDSGEFIVCYLGQLTATVEFATVVAAARRLRGDQRRIRFVVCGAGGHEQAFRTIAGDCPNIVFPGWVGRDEIWTLLEMSRAGLVCYHSSFDYRMSIPNKPIEYMAGSVPVVSSLEGGSLATLLAKHRCGATYRNGDAESLTSILCDWYDQPDAQRAAASRARALYEDRFDAETVYASMARLLERVAAEHGSGTSASAARSPV